MKRLGQILLAPVVFLFVASWMIEWAIWGVWLAPVVLGIYLFARDSVPGRGLRDRYLAMLVLMSAWPYGYSLGEYVLPRLPGWLAGLGLMPFREDHVDYVSTDYTMVWIAIAFSIMGFLGFMNVSIAHMSERLTEYNARKRFYAVSGVTATAAAVAGLYLTAHPIAAGFLGVMGGFWFLASLSQPEDPGELASKLRGTSPEIAAGGEARVATAR